MTNLIVPNSPGLVGPNGAPIGNAAPEGMDDLTTVHTAGAFMQSQGVHTLPTNVKICDALGEHSLPALAFPPPALVRLMAVLSDGGRIITSLAEDLKKAHKQVADFSAIAVKRRDIIGENLKAAKADKAKAAARIAALEAALEDVIDSCASTEAGTLDDSRRTLEAAHKVLNAKGPL